MLNISPPNIKAYLSLLCVCLVWGTTYLVIRIGVADFPPFLFSAIRQVTAGGSIVLFFVLRSGPRPSKKVVYKLALSGMFMITFGNGVLAWAEKFVESGLTALICSIMPVWMVLLNYFLKSEKINATIVTGVLLGLGGITIIFHDNLQDFLDMRYTWGIVVIFISTLSWTIGTLLTKSIRTDIHFLFSAGIQLLAGGMFLFLMSLIFDDWRKLSVAQIPYFSLAYMIFIGSILSYSAYHYALKKLPATLVSVYAYVNPIIAIGLGALILDEKLNQIIILALAITLSGIYFINKGFNSQKHENT